MLNALSNYALGQFANRFTLTCGIVGGLPAIEMAIRVIVDFAGMLQQRTNMVTGPFDAHAKNLTADMSGALFYGLLAANIIPGSAVVGATCFTGFSFYKYYLSGKPEECYLTSKALVLGTEFMVKDVIGKPIIALFKRVIKPTTKFVFNRIIHPGLKFTRDYVVRPVWNHVLKPVIDKIGAFVSAVYNIIGDFFKALGHFLARIHIPNHPMWKGVILVVSAIAIYKLAVPFVFSLS